LGVKALSWLMVRQRELDRGVIAVRELG